MIKPSRVFFLVVFIVAASGCDIFTTRDPEPPDTGSSAFVPPTFSDLVLVNLANAISERNAGNYLRCFPDSLSSDRTFQFVPTTAAASRYASVFASWSLQSERSWFSSLTALTATAATSNLTLTGSFTLVASDSAVYQGDYQLVFPHGVTGAPESVRGAVQFVLAMDRNSLWSIARWIDTPRGNEPAWSELKGRFAN